MYDCQWNGDRRHFYQAQKCKQLVLGFLDKCCLCVEMSMLVKNMVHCEIPTPAAPRPSPFSLNIIVVISNASRGLLIVPKRSVIVLKRSVIVPTRHIVVQLPFKKKKKAIKKIVVRLLGCDRFFNLHCQLCFFSVLLLLLRFVLPMYLHVSTVTLEMLWRFSFLNSG